ncbi:hypothetical protein [Bradyrhizobium sp.]|uniref:hypothetical protein n=1 Tax=Bradyrhizobium sp. TaxID=376 RepID=UPI0040379F97
MGMMVSLEENAKDINFLREVATRLQQLPNNDWTDWEWEWLAEMTRKPDTYLPSEKERQKLAQIASYAEPFSGYDGLSVTTMVGVCHRYHLDFREEDGDFIVDLHHRQATTVRRRQLRRLVRLFTDSGENSAASWSYEHAEPA